MVSQKTNVYAWDFVLSGCDTLREIYRDLYDKISIFCLRKLEDADANLAIVSCCKDISSALSVCVEMAGKGHLYEPRFVPKYEELEDGKVFCGQIKKECGNNGYCTDFNLYEDPQVARDEVIIRSGDKVTVIKIFNFPFVEEANEQKNID